MIEIIGVRFKPTGKVYYFDPKGMTFAVGDRAVVETVRGQELGTVVIANKSVEEDERFLPLSPALRAATEADLEAEAKNREKAQRAMDICRSKIKKHKLDMTLIDAEYTFDGGKITFNFVAEGRVDFRELVKDLASVFKTRIELRQIGVRDETKALGGLGMCGRKVCCADFLTEFMPVSIKMAKDQGISTNPQKISGTCGKLICCLNYEQNVYEDAYKTMPRNGNIVLTPDGRGVVTESNVLKEQIHVRLDGDEPVFKVYTKDQVRVVKTSKNGKDVATEPAAETKSAE